MAKKPGGSSDEQKGLSSFEDLDVEKALYKRAVGYDYEESERTEEELASGGVKTRVKIAKKHVEPNMQALMFWLKNRRPEVWKEKRDADACDADETEFEAIMEEVDGIE